MLYGLWFRGLVIRYSKESKRYQSIYFALLEGMIIIELDSPNCTQLPMPTTWIANVLFEQEKMD